MVNPSLAYIRRRQHCCARVKTETSEARQICENSCKAIGRATFAISVPVSVSRCYFFDDHLSDSGRSRWRSRRDRRQDPPRETVGAFRKIVPAKPYCADLTRGVRGRLVLFNVINRLTGNFPRLVSFE
jgi:hypothetical protein